MSTLASPSPAPPARLRAREAMEELNAEAGKFNIWLRTQANAPAQRPWFRDTGVEASGTLAAGRVGANQIKAAPHRWRWSEIGPYLDRIAEIARNCDVPPIEFAERQQFLLTNPGLGGRLQVTNTIRCAVSIYNPGDVAPVHVHTPNASRTILSENGGYTVVEGERCEAERGDLILTPHGAWHDHGNDGATPVVWIDVLDFPLMEFLDCVWLDDEFHGERAGNGRAQAAKHADGYSQKLYGAGGLLPGFVSHRRGISRHATPMIHYRGAAIREALAGLAGEAGDPYEGITLAFVNPVNGGPAFPTLAYTAQLLRPGEETRLKRETASTMYVVMEGQGATEIAGRRFDWERNDIFVVPNFLWRRHINTGRDDAVLYSVSDAPLMEKVGQYRAQGRGRDGAVENLVA
ncbi:MAG TPA: cupin domain-containing protein [Xanthobacteraceae bacterium]|nr:cupin domain-containing protein [Xanthobacteraceae bacterium]